MLSKNQPYDCVEKEKLGRFFVQFFFFSAKYQRIVVSPSFPKKKKDMKHGKTKEKT